MGGWRTAFIYFASLFWANLGPSLAGKNIVLLHTLDSHSFKDAYAFAKSVSTEHSSAWSGNTEVVMFITRAHYAGADAGPRKEAGELKALSIRHYSPKISSLRDRSIGKSSKTEERVTSILDGLGQTLANASSNAIVASMAFKKGTTPHPLPAFGDFFKKAAAAAAATSPGPGANLGADVVLLGKTRRLTSVSDWHDLGIMMLRNNEAVRRWLQVFTEVYYHHADRGAFSLLEPRPALLEATFRSLYPTAPADSPADASQPQPPALKVEYFTKGQVCRLHGMAPPPEGQLPASMDHCLQLSSFLSMECTDGSHDGGGSSPCHTLDEPHIWKLKIERSIPQGFANRPPWLKPDQWKEKLHEAIWTGSLRFVHPRDDRTPRPMCWETPWLLPAAMTGSASGAGPELYAGDGSGSSTPWREWRPNSPKANPHHLNISIGSASVYSDGSKGSGAMKKTPGQEQLAASRIYAALNSSEAFVHDRKKWQKFAGEHRSKVVLMTGSQANTGALESKLHLQLVKMLYAKRHGYTFLHALSNQFTAFFTPDLYGAIRAEMTHTAYFRGLMSKTLMLADTLLRHPTHEWVVWTDDDVYINSGWLYLPLEAFLSRAPKDKVYVSANYRSMFTNVFAVRNTEQGRRLVYDWLAIAMSGHVQCHGFDQAAIGHLLLARIAGTMNNPNPFNHTCLWSENGFVGCNAKGDWSCDFKVEASLYRAGFKTRQADFFGQKVSSFTKGCGNDAVKDFHVLAETKELPRWQCGLCSRLYEVESCGHWDGPLGGGNDLLRRGAVNGWFFNHKADFLFWEAYLDPANCDYEPEAIPVCSGNHPFGGAGGASGNGSGNTIWPEWPQLPTGFNFTTYNTGAGGGAHGGGAGMFVGVGDARGVRGVGVGHAHHHAAPSLLSLVDGYAFDVEAGTYCRTTDPHLLYFQHTRTYMKDYPALIAAIKQGYSLRSWWDAYKGFNGGEGRDGCWKPKSGSEWPAPVDPKKCEHGWGPDGQKNRKRKWDNEDHYLERAVAGGAGAGDSSDQFCSKECKPTEASAKWGGVRGVDCRRESDVREEKERKVNQEEAYVPP